MKLALDTNVLVYAHLAGLPEHPQVHRFLSDALREAKTVLVLTPLVIHEFLHVVTDARRFEPPIEMTVALTLARSYLDRSNVEWLAVDEAAIALTIELMRTEGLGRKRIADTLLVGTLLGHGVGKLATCDPEHFAGFDGLELIDPR